ncbi:MAG: helix-turn-helix transcriptional regulator [Sphaerochaetaceae bacterium]
MRFSYNKLWKLLIDKGMNKKELREATGLSTTAIAKLGKGENVTTDVLLRICKALECDVCDIMEFIKDGQVNE